MIFKAKIKEIGAPLGEETMITFNIDEDELMCEPGVSEISFNTSYGLERKFLINNTDLYILSEIITSRLNGPKDSTD